MNGRADRKGSLRARGRRADNQRPEAADAPGWVHEAAPDVQLELALQPVLGLPKRGPSTRAGTDTGTASVWGPGVWSPSTPAAATTTEISLFSHLLISSHCNPRGSQMAEEHGKWGVEIPSPSSTEITEGQVLTAGTAPELSSVDNAAWWPALETT